MVEEPVIIAPAPVIEPKEVCSEGVLEGVNFHSNSAQLTTEAENILKGVAHKLNNCGTNSFTIVGHTDNVGSEASNLSLSQRRATTTQLFLMLNGVQAERLACIGKGETQPRADNTTDQGRAANRRVELVRK